MPRVLSGFLLAGVLSLVAVPAPAAEPAPPRVVASILPVHGLATRLMANVGEPSLLVRPGSSPHGYQLRPSEAASLEKADLVFWVGEPMETFLLRPLGNLPQNARVVTLLDAPGMRLLPTREGGVWDAHDHDGHEEAHHGQEHDHGAGRHEHGDHDHHEDTHGHDRAEAVDGHVWLAPDNARAMAAAMAAALIEADPARADTYRANAAALDASLEALDSELRATLAPVSSRPFVVFHDAWRYLEEAYDLAAAGSITVSPERMPGAKRITELRHTITERGAVCIFAEPQMPSRLVATVAEGTGVRIGEIDPLGSAAAEPGADAYETLMRRNAAELARCLSSES